MKRVLLTGVAGFIGAHTLEHFLENTDWHITGIDSLKHRGDIRRIWQVLGKNEKWAKRFEFVKMDLAYTGDHPRSVAKFWETPFDFIINMASESHVDRSITDPLPFVRNNVDLTLNMLEWARRIKPAAFVQISTDEVYGPMIAGRPFVEWERLLPSNPYSASKAAQEMIAISYWRTYNVPVLITNTMNNIGEMQDVEKFVPMIINNLQRGKTIPVHGTETEIGSRFYLHARNHADALLFLLKNVKPAMYNPLAKKSLPGRYNIVGNTQIDNLTMVRKIAALLQIEPRYYMADYHSSRPGHDLHYGLNGTRLARMGWKPPLGFDESLERTVENYLENPQWLEAL